MEASFEELFNTTIGKSFKVSPKEYAVCKAMFFSGVYISLIKVVANDAMKDESVVDIVRTISEAREITKDSVVNITGPATPNHSHN